MEITYEFQWNTKVRLGLKKIPDDILYSVARQTLDLSYPIIPKDTTTMARSSMSNGVRGGNGDFYIGSFTDYASYVWKMENVHWTTPGTTNKWFARTLNKNGKTIIDNAINQSWRKDM